MNTWIAIYLSLSLAIAVGLWLVSSMFELKRNYKGLAANLSFFDTFAILGLTLSVFITAIIKVFS